MKNYLDCEFIDDGEKVHLISMGLVAEDDREYYAQSVEFDPNKASPWVKENVYTHLEICSLTTNLYQIDSIEDKLRKHINGQCNPPKHYRRSDCPWRTREQIRSEVQVFLDPAQYGQPELHGWCSGYDFVALCQLFGTMMDLPKEYPHYIKDLQQVLDEHGITDDQLPQQELGLHNALSDARWIRHLWQWVGSIQASRFAQALSMAMEQK